jgi:DNA-binding CsgD family transcriptional regulator
VLPDFKKLGLTEREIAVLSLSFYDRLTTRSVAERSGISQVYVRQLLKSGAKKLAAAGFELPKVSRQPRKRVRLQLMDGNKMARRFTYDDSYVNAR